MNQRARIDFILAGALFCFLAFPAVAQMDVQIGPGPVDPNAVRGSPLDPRNLLLRPQPVEPEPVNPSMRMPRAPYPESARPQPGYPSSYTMTLTRGRATPPGDEPINRARDVAERLMQCWTPPASPMLQEISVRLAFNRAGRTVSPPVVSYIGPNARGEARDALRKSLLQAISACLPLRFTPGLASAIAGRPFAIRFIAPGTGNGGASTQK